MRENLNFTFIIFSSSEIILSGRYYNSMKEQYEFVIETVNKHRHVIEEKLSKPKMSLREYLEIISSLVNTCLEKLNLYL